MMFVPTKISGTLLVREDPEVEEGQQREAATFDFLEDLSGYP